MIRQLKCLIALIVIMVAGTVLAETVRLSELDLSKVQQGWGWPRADKSCDGNMLTIANETYQYGLGTHADSVLYIELKNSAKRIRAKVGVDDEVKPNTGTVIFKIITEKKELYNSGTMKTGDPAKSLDVDISGCETIILMAASTGDGINYDHADWVDVTIDYEGKRPETIDAPKEEAVILTPKPGPEPRINSARVFGVRPGSPVLYTVAATGDRPMTFSAKGLPDGVKIDRQTGCISGVIKSKGEYSVELIATNKNGDAKAKLSICVGDTIALTPPMGWNSWNCWACAVDDQKIRESARAMVESGLINHGWQYINIDDCWMRKPDQDPRDSEGMLLTNEKFPDMKGLVDYIHSLGLKAGTYISPGPTTCAGYVGSYQYEMKDAIQFAHWGFDYLKYDWCGYSNVEKSRSLEALKKPYQVMRECLDKADRDIVYSLCQYGMGEVWTWGEEVGGNCWRTTGDITDTWGSMSGIGFSQDKCAPYGNPGHWNDPDMLVVGKVGWGPNLHPSRLTPNEQYTHISLWCLLPSPLLIGCDLADMDEFTLNLLTNDEVLAINQDPLGYPARRIPREDQAEIWWRKLQDGTLAVGLFNRSEFEQEVNIQWSELNLTGRQPIRDLWRQKDLGSYRNEFKASIPRHGVTFIKVGKSR